VRIDAVAVGDAAIRPRVTNENANQIAAPDFVAPLPTGSGNTMQGAAMLDFPKSIITDLIPFIDKAYRTVADGEHRAIAGLSMGGGMTLLAAFNNLDTFAWVGTFSAGLPPMPGVAVKIAPPANAASLRGPDVTNTIDKAKRAALLPQLTADANARLRLFYVGIGSSDGLITAHGAFKELLQEKGRQGHHRGTAGLLSRVGLLAGEPPGLCAASIPGNEARFRAAPCVETPGTTWGCSDARRERRASQVRHRKGHQ
jgi:enterochelin esterase family protein